MDHTAHTVRIDWGPFCANGETWDQEAYFSGKRFSFYGRSFSERYQYSIDTQTMWQSLIFVISDTGIKYSNGSCRVLLWTTAIFAVMLYTCYSGTMVSILSVPKYSILNLDSLIASDYKIYLELGYNNGSSIQLILEVSYKKPAKNRNKIFVFNNIDSYKRFLFRLWYIFQQSKCFCVKSAFRISHSYLLPSQ